MNLSSQISGIRNGHIFLILCCLIYLIWWSITFHPEKTYPSLPKYILFVGIAAAGIAGVARILYAVSDLPVLKKASSNLMILAGGILLYALLLYLTGHFLHRQVTTELFLITGWMILELCVLSSIYRADAIALSSALVMLVIVILAAAVSMVCYLAYYDLPPMKAFYDGMVPLILFAVVMLVQTFVIR